MQMASTTSSSRKVRPPSLAVPDKQDPVRRSSPAGGSQATATENWLLRRMLRRLGDPAITIVLWDGRRIATSDVPPVALMRIHGRRALLELLLNPELGFGDAYSDGKIEIEGDLLEFLETIYRSVSSTNTSGGLLRTQSARWLSRIHSNTIGRSRRNVHHHYDIRDDFYRIWLDERMVYTCAYFSDPAMTLEKAQVAKMDHVCRKLRLCPGQTVAEAGFGWGALALHMARHYGVRVRAYNLSHEQTQFARRRAQVEGLASRVEFIEDDYRNVSGRFDVFVSVGMLEHVGREHYHDLGKAIDRCLKSDGRGLIHSIGRNRPASLNAWTERRIFPGAHVPSLKEIMDVLQPRDFSVLDVENLRLHYAKTLEHWLDRYQAHEDRVAEMFDERFVRMWRLYLAGSIASFTTGSLQLFQILFTRAGVNEIPWTRAWLYKDN
jgi:cyclopropane-fatty-acyl-phospholipid synthase